MEETPVKQQKSIARDHGRRKEASARVRLFKGKGQFTVNDKTPEDFFKTPSDLARWKKVLTITGVDGKYWATIKVAGSGHNGQLDAAIHSIARVLSKQEPELKAILKKAGYLTRDPRVKERRKYGRAQKARKGKQSPKR